MRTAGAVALCLLVAALGGCRGATRTPTGGRVAPGGPMTPGFQGMRSVIVRATALREAGDVAGLRRMSPEIAQHGLGLIRSGYPHDLRDGDVEHFREGREAFGDRLKAWVRATEDPDDAALLAALDELTQAYWSWVDAYKGLPPERSV